MTRATTLVALAAAFALSSCQDLYASNQARPSRAPAIATPAPSTDNDRPGPRAVEPSEMTPHPAPVARAAAGVFALSWANWDWHTVASQQRAIARLATGELREQLRATGSSARIDASLARDRPGSRGVVAAISVKARGGTHAAGIVVTHEQSYTDGRADLGGRRYRVYVVRLKREQRGWEVSTWQPQP